MTHGEEENLDLRQRRTRQSLVKALEELLVERPYQSLSVTDICQRAMVHRTTFYAHFNDKQELLRYLLLGVERRCVEACLPRDWSGEARDYFLTAARNVLDFFQSRRDLYRACLHSGADVDAHVLEDQTAEDLCRLLSHPRFHATVPDSDPRITARFYTGAMLALLRWWLDSEEPVSEECLLSHLERFIPAL
ncbi:TetR/AcrR family transcriptional regulator [Intestinimonas butyriciproducens]|uniref:TetR/AcrR family transcriptional regulator n=1 Tax=Candidatus Intestinimonas merdavium TaxID=2838622 RepID=A0A9D1Z3C5_9FIRM|nr:TetR/AcrR family transcriptional regulator [Intestinimonas butyriciproducens]MBM6974283.1 TetR family transcriptional regulator [Intestinimonas butyriciproducens]HIY73269.1 TetR/AcrR family transcriptional regulator [Candidatus Intestinimonas merdavium]